MKTQKLSLKSVKNALSRAEMRNIMAGSGGGGGGGGGGNCTTGQCAFIYPIIQTPCCAGLSCQPGAQGSGYCA